MEEHKKIGKKLDKLVMGIILGGAIGSVVGLTLAPRKGKETRAMMKQKGEEFIKSHHETFESAKYQIKKGRGFFAWLLARLRKKKNSGSQSMPKSSMEETEE